MAILGASIFPGIKPSGAIELYQVEASEGSPALDLWKEGEVRKSHRDASQLPDTCALFLTVQKKQAVLNSQVAPQISRLKGLCLIYTSWKV